MSYSLYLYSPRDDVVAIPRFWVTLALSLLIHGLLLWLVVPKLPLLKQGDKSGGEAESPLSVRLVTRAVPPAPQPTPPAEQSREAPPARVLTQPRRIAPQPRPTPPVVAVVPPQPVAPIIPPPTPPAPTPPVAAPAPPPPLQGDLAAYIASRRLARGESAEGSGPTAAEREKARRDAIVAANIGSLRADAFGQEPKNGGGTFQIRSMAFDSAEISFYGWNRDIGRRTFQVLEVRRGDNTDINIAIVRRIIAIIRDYENADFRWDSKRLGRDLILSARPQDNAELEAFMMQEFFTASHQAR